MDYYQYRMPNDADTGSKPTDSGKIIDPVPILRLFLEPRSLVITHGSLYAEHLHGIFGASRDLFVSPRHSSLEPRQNYQGQETTQVVNARDIANKELLGDTTLRDELVRLSASVGVLSGEQPAGDAMELERHIRTSLTCRVVEKTAVAVGKLVKIR
ncbi:hypothetical protein FRC08_010668 [Ceratobasidium sp. 394]|nr:hypothetical protein FRC08_010668 [Ceratobasidium sp. 394]